MIHYYYGYGKGKTTSAIGAGVRAKGAGLDVLLVQFFKDDKSNELNAIPFACIKAPSALSFNPDKDAYIPWIRSAISQIEDSNANVIILDEFSDLYPDYLDQAEMKSVLKDNSKEYIITGHKRVDFLYEMADYVTRFEKQKHPYDKGQEARAGIEF